MVGSELVNLASLLDDAKCFALVRQHRWPEGVRCPACDSAGVVRDGYDNRQAHDRQARDRQAHRQRYRCKACAGRVDDLTGTVLAGHHQPLRVWVLCLIGANFRLGVLSRPVIPGGDAARILRLARGALA